MITLFVIGLAAVAVGPLLAIFVADRVGPDASAFETASAGMFVALNDNAARSKRIAA